MAYLATIQPPVCSCGRKATAELRNWRNEVIAKVCRACGNRRLPELQAMEDRDRDHRS